MHRPVDGEGKPVASVEGARRNGVVAPADAPGAVAKPVSQAEKQARFRRGFHLPSSPLFEVDRRVVLAVCGAVGLVVLLDPIGSWFKHTFVVAESPEYWVKTIDFLGSMGDDVKISLLVFSLLALTFDAFARRNIEHSFIEAINGLRDSMAKAASDLEGHGNEVVASIQKSTVDKIIETHLGSSAKRAASVFASEGRVFTRPSLSVHVEIKHHPFNLSDNILELLIVSHWTVQNETNERVTYRMAVTDDRPRVAGWVQDFEVPLMSWRTMRGNQEHIDKPKQLPVPVKYAEGDWFKEAAWPVAVEPKAEGEATIVWRVTRHIADHYDIPLWYVTENVEVTVSHPADLEVVVGALGVTYGDYVFDRVAASSDPQYSAWRSKLPLLPAQGITVKWREVAAGVTKSPRRKRPAIRTRAEQSAPQPDTSQLLRGGPLPTNGAHDAGAAESAGGEPRD